MTTHAIPLTPPTPTAHAPTGRPTAPSSRRTPRRSPPGPTADLVALPDREEVELSAPAEVYTYLLQAEAARQRQLDVLPEVDRDAVAAAYRATVEGILAEVRTARRRAEAGLYGICTGCGAAISAERLELRPWATSCAWCASRER